MAAAIVGAGVAFSAPSAAVFHNQYVSFRYPAGWHLRQWTPTGGELRFAVWLSNVKLRPPCVREGDSITCSDPLRRLPRGAVLVTWELVRPPGFRARSAPLSITRPGACRDAGADETMSESFASGTVVTACVRAPGTAGREHAVRAMLASTRIVGS